jgi:hypothetical protein
MKKTIRNSLLALAGVSLLGISSARAQEDDYTKDTWPLEATRRPLTLDAGMLEIRGNTFQLNLNKNHVGEPFSLAPSIYYGIDKKLTVGITHAIGICLAGEDSGCDKIYNDFAIDALYGLMLRGSFQLAAHGGLAVPAIDPFMMGLNVGLKGRINAGNLAIVFDPRLYIGFTERDNAAMYGKEQLFIPVWVQFQVNTQTMIYAVSGMNGQLDGFGAHYRVPIGAGALFAVNNRIDFGGEVVFDNLAGHDHSADARWLILRAALRL